MARHKKLQLTCEVDEGIPVYFSGIRHYLDRTLLNLLSNALKFTKEGFIKLKVEMLSKKCSAYHFGDEVELKITVQDSGMGIPEDKFDTIFEHFSRLTPAYQGLYKGAGLGLYTVKRYIEAMKATIKVESEVGKGTSFIITLPLIVSDHSDREKIPFRSPKIKRPPVIKPISSSKAKTKKLASADTIARILIVEDNSLAARAAKSVVNSLYSHCDCDTAENGKQAIEKVTKNQYDLIFMDIGLADGEDGIGVTKQIRALNNPYAKQIPVVALTGHGNDPEMRKEILAAGMQDVFAKPLSTTLLESLMQRYVFKHEKEVSHSTESTPSDTKQTSQVINWAKSLEQCAGDEALLRELLSGLALDLKMFKEKLEKYYTAHDEQALRQELHRVRGGVVYLTLPQLDNALSLFHETVKEKPQNPKQLQQLYVQLQQAMKTFWEYVGGVGL